MRIRLTRVLLLAGAAGAVVLSSCGGGGGTVQADLAEFSIALDPVSISAGEVTFDTDNVGEFAHELVVVQSDLGATGLPVTADGGVDTSQVEIIGGIPQFDGGASDTLTVDLAASNYVVFCNIVFTPEGGDPVAHYANGMTASFVVE